MNLDDINNEYIKLQNKYGDKDLDAVLNGGCKDNPELCLIFMNPTGKNVCSSKEWKGIKAPWIGTKRVWKVLNDLNLIDNEINELIQNKKPKDWDYVFAELVYQHIEDKGIYITNLGKCTQIDARPLPDKVFKNYLDLLDKEISFVNPRKIICFGNQVSSLFLNEKISVSKVRKKAFSKVINNKSFETYAVYYPVGNGSFNIDKAMEDMSFILNKKE